MELNKIRKYLLNKDKCVKDVIITDVMNINTMEHTGNRINVYLDNKAWYQPNWLIDLQNEIGADDCVITTERNSLKVIFFVSDKIEEE
jgi:hypothetical protein